MSVILALAGEVPFYRAIYQKKLPGDVKLPLSKTPEDADSESALTLRFLHSTLPQWDFDLTNVLPYYPFIKPPFSDQHNKRGEFRE